MKFIAGSALTLIYTIHYSDRGSADIYKFYDDAQVIASALPNHPGDYFKLLSGFYDDDESLANYTNSMKNWMPQSEEWLDFAQTKNYNLFQSNRIITRINAILIPVTFGNIFTHVLIFSWISLIGIIAFLTLFRGNENPFSYLILVLFPSLILWCSPPLKDTLTLWSVCVIFFLAYQISRKGFTIKRLVFLCFALIILMVTKYYVAVAFAPALIFLFIQKHYKKIIEFRVFTVVSTGLALTLLLVYLFPSAIDMMNGKREEALKAAIFGEANHLLFTHLIDNGFRGFVIEVPQALYSAFFRPMIWEGKNSLLVLLSAMENLFLMFLIIFCMIKKWNKKQSSEYFYPFLIFSISLAFIIGYTTPVAGGLVRYKTAFLLPLLFICLDNLNLPNAWKDKPQIQSLMQWMLKQDYPNSSSRIA